MRGRGCTGGGRVGAEAGTQGGVQRGGGRRAIPGPARALPPLPEFEGRAQARVPGVCIAVCAL